MYKRSDDPDQYLNIKHYLLSRTLLIVLSLSLLPLLFHYFPEFSIFPYSLTHSLERKYMFLVCNGILVFLAKSSVSSEEISTSSNESLILNGKLSSELAISDHDRDNEETMKVEHEVKFESDKSCGSDEDKNDEEIEGNEVSNTLEDEEEEEEEKEEEEEEEEEEESMSTEELNKKIEEFIRKMKEEIRVEAQQQLIAV